MASFESQLFLFFPTFGLIGLFAFWRAGVVIVDAYWRRIRGGKLIFVGAVLALVGVSAFLAYTFQSAPNRMWWEVAKPALLADEGEPAGCTPPDCDRAPIVEAYSAVRLLARDDDGLAGLAEECEAENMSAFRPQEERVNFCFVTGAIETVADCCAAKIRFKQAVVDLHEEAPSLTHYVHKYLLPLKVFFLLMLLVIGVTLARRRRTLELHYPSAMEQVERTMPVGALSMMLWPLMNQAYAQSFDMLFGAGGSGAFRVTAPLYTLAFGGWAMVLMFYYFRRYPKATEGAAKVIGGLLAGVGIIQYEAVLAWVNHFLGAGASVVSIAVMLVIAAFLTYETLFHVEDPYDEDDSKPFEKAPLGEPRSERTTFGEVIGELVE